MSKDPFLQALLVTDVVCREDPELFFPSYTPNEINDAQIEAAKALCRTCPLIDLCFDFAVRTDDQHGIFAATTPQDRADLAEEAAALEELTEELQAA